jgi:Tol biopolymer transport system component
MAFALAVGLASTPEASASIATKQVSVTRRGSDPRRSSSDPSITPDGRYVAFFSWASDLVAEDGNGEPDVFVRDLVLGTTTLVSVALGGGAANGISWVPSISADGRYVAFQSAATNLVPGDRNHTADIFVRDLVAATTSRASVDTDGGDPDDISSSATINSEGRYVAFDSLATDLVPGDGNRKEDVFVRDMVAGTTTRVSVDVDGGDPNDGSSLPSISTSGRFVAFESSASDLVLGDQNFFLDVFVRDLVGGTTVRVSVDVDGGDPNNASSYPAFSGNERYVVFVSGAKDLVENDGNGVADVFLRDLVLGVTTLVSVGYRGRPAANESLLPAVNEDGRYVAFASLASNLIQDDVNATSDIFVRDLLEGVTIRASVDVEGGDPNAGSGRSSISASGRVAAFESDATDLVPGRGDKWEDVFVARLD